MEFNDMSPENVRKFIEMMRRFIHVSTPPAYVPRGRTPGNLRAEERKGRTFNKGYNAAKRVARIAGYRPRVGRARRHAIAEARSAQA